MRKILLAVAAISMVGVGSAEAGCYRLGLTGYHHYQSCIGPRVLYPHRKYCSWRHGYRHCWYR